MLAHFLSIRLGQRNIHYGWVMAAVTFLTMLGTAGAVGAPGFLLCRLKNSLAGMRPKYPLPLPSGLPCLA